MKNSMFLSDFLLLKDVLCEELVEDCISTYDKLKREPERVVENLDRLSDNICFLYDLFLEEKQDEFIHFDDEEHFHDTIQTYVEMMWDTKNTKKGYVINQCYQMTSPVKQ